MADRDGLFLVSGAWVLARYDLYDAIGVSIHLVTAIIWLGVLALAAVHRSSAIRRAGMGPPIGFVVAVFDVSSVRKVMVAQIIVTIT